MCHSKNLSTFEKSERASEMEGEKEKEHVREEIGRRKENYLLCYLWEISCDPFFRNVVISRSKSKDERLNEGRKIYLL